MRGIPTRISAPCRDVLVEHDAVEDSGHSFGLVRASGVTCIEDAREGDLVVLADDAAAQRLVVG